MGQGFAWPVISEMRTSPNSECAERHDRTASRITTRITRHVTPEPRHDRTASRSELVSNLISDNLAEAKDAVVTHAMILVATTTNPGNPVKHLVTEILELTTKY